MNATTPERLGLLLLAAVLSAPGCQYFTEDDRIVPKEDRFGIYALDVASGDVGMVMSTDLRMRGLALDRDATRFTFSGRYGGDALVNEEVCVVKVDGTGLQRLSSNDYIDTYPAWSPDGTRIMYLSWPDSSLDIWVMDADGGNRRLVFDSGSHDADISWVGNRVAFTTGSRVWLMHDDGTDPVRLTDPPRAGEWGNAVLPFGDYDPRVDPDGTRMVFERLVDDRTTHGNYDLFLVNADGTGETRLTETGWTQGMANWSSDGQRLVFIVSAIGTDGAYDIYLMNADGSGRRSITPDYFPDDFLCHSPVFGPGDSTVYFIGEWWE